MSTVAIVGLGRMGSRIARRFLEAGHEVLIWNRTVEKARPLTEQGAVWVDTPAEAAHRAEVVITMVADPSALRDVTEGPTGVAGVAGDGVTLIEMSTVGPAAISRLASQIPSGTGLLDAPVLGSVSEAESGSLNIFVGGSASLFERWKPLLSALGSPLHVGPLGSGAGAKLVANATLLGVLGVLGEVTALADGLGLRRESTFEVLAVTPLAAQAERRRPAIESGDYPARYSLSLARKDAGLIEESAEASGVELRLLEAARTWFADAEADGLGDQDYSAVLARILRSR